MPKSLERRAKWEGKPITNWKHATYVVSKPHPFPLNYPLTSETFNFSSFSIITSSSQVRLLQKMLRMCWVFVLLTALDLLLTRFCWLKFVSLIRHIILVVLNDLIRAVGLDWNYEIFVEDRLFIAPSSIFSFWVLRVIVDLK